MIMRKPNPKGRTIHEQLGVPRKHPIPTEMFEEATRQRKVMESEMRMKMAMKMRKGK